MLKRYYTKNFINIPLRTMLYALLIFIANTAFAVTIQGMRVWPSPSSIRIVFDLDQNANYKIGNTGDPSIISIDFHNAKLSANFSKQVPSNTPIDNFAFNENANNYTVKLTLQEKMIAKDFTLAPNQYYGHRLVIDLESKEKQDILALFDSVQQWQSAPAELKPLQNVATSKYIVAIDAGHGGEDPGAIGPRGTKEKDVVLAITREVQKELNKDKKIKSVLIRNSDYYVGLYDRVLHARKQNSDLLVSIHADAYQSSRASGASVHMLSDNGATSEAAKWLAEKENRSDIIGGVSLSNKGDILTKVLLDLSQTANEGASLAAANMLIQSLDNVTKLHKPNVERAGFAVLKAPDVPSILIESGFISNPKTEMRLREPKYQRKLAIAIAGGIRNYLENYAKKMQKETSQQNVPERAAATTKSIVVESGDTLYSISRNNKVSLGDIKKWNNLTTDSLAVGQEIKIAP